MFAHFVASKLGNAKHQLDGVGDVSARSLFAVISYDRNKGFLYYCHVLHLLLEFYRTGSHSLLYNCRPVTRQT